MMRRVAMLVVLSAVVISWAVSAAAAPKAKRPSARPKKDRGDDFPAAAQSADAPASFTDDMEKLKEQVGLKEDQVTKLTGMRKRRDDLLGKQSEAARKRIAAARAKVDKIKKAPERQRMARQLDAYIKRLERTQQTLAATHERTMFAVLTPDQKAKWNAPVLQAHVEKELESLALTDEQKTRIRQLCETEGKRMTLPASATTSSTAVKLLANQANLRVLTAEQKRAYAKIRAARTRGSRTPKG